MKHSHAPAGLLQLRPRIKKGFALSWRGLGVTAFILCAASLVGLLFYRVGITEANIVTMYLLAVLCTALATSGRLYGILASVASVLVFNYLFTVPRFTLKFNDVSRYSVTFFVMFAAACITSTLAMRVKAQAQRATREAARSELLLKISQALQRAEGEAQILSETATRLSEFLHASVLLWPVQAGRPGEPFSHAPEDGAAPGSSPADRQALCQVAAWGGQARAGRLYLAVGQSVPPLAVAGLAGNGGAYVPDSFDQPLVQALLSECALALEKDRMRREKSRVELSAQQEQLRSNLLRTISHDLRTPLTSISGSAGILLNNSSALDEAARHQLYADIYADSLWLIQVVENLLSITRLENGALDLHLQPELVEDVVGEALQHLSRRSGEYRLTVSLQGELLMARMDSRLITQVIINLVNNAIKYTPPGTKITLRAQRQGGMVRFEIADEGPGVPEEAQKKLFQMFYTASGAGGDSRRGLGLGLALCRSIVEAHGGEIGMYANQPHGSVFYFTLPAEEAGQYE